VAANPWQIANTTVRNPYRLKEGLRALVASPLLGNLVGTAQETAFTELLHEAGVVYVKRIESGEQEDYPDTGRKWRSALDKMGFITPKLSRKLDEHGYDPRISQVVANIAGLTGMPYELTAQGRRLINAKTLIEEQECFLRALVVRQVEPFILAEKQPNTILYMVLKIMAELESRGAAPSISFEEMASVVQLVAAEDEIDDAVNVMISYREKRGQAGNKKSFDNKFRQSYTKLVKPTALRTLTDYADMNLRYLRATGLFSQIGRRMTFAERRRALIEQLIARPHIPESNEAYYHNLWSGAELPTDNESEALESIHILAADLRRRGEGVSLPALASLAIPDLTQVRYKLEKRLEQLREDEFAEQQRDKWDEILEYMADLSRSKAHRERVPPSEDPAYLEWSVWRAFLAIDSLVNKPSEARRFQVDQDFLPVRPAPGNGPDMLFEFEEYVLVVEVTMSGGSRQEAMEGEPVRRHVAKAVEAYERAGKYVYGLFIAIIVDTNTAETFRVGTWYRSDDSRLSLGIVPLRLEQFHRIFKSGFMSGSLQPQTVRDILDRCLAHRGVDAPEWKALIESEVEDACQHLSY
jgi:hypothetical protein